MLSGATSRFDQADSPTVSLEESDPLIAQPFFTKRPLQSGQTYSPAIMDCVFVTEIAKSLRCTLGTARLQLVDLSDCPTHKSCSNAELGSALQIAKRSPG